MGPGTTYVGTEHSPGNTASSSAKAEPACYSIPAGCAATQKASGEGIDSSTPSDRAAPAAGQTILDCRRLQARGWGIRGRSVSCPRRGRGTTTNTPSTTTQGATQSQPGCRSRSGCPDPAMMASKYHSSGWRRDLEHVLKVYYKHTVQPLSGSRNGLKSGNSSLTASSQRRLRH